MKLLNRIAPISQPPSGYRQSMSNEPLTVGLLRAELDEFKANLLANIVAELRNPHQRLMSSNAEQKSGSPDGAGGTALYGKVNAHPERSSTESAPPAAIGGKFGVRHSVKMRRGASNVASGPGIRRGQTNLQEVLGVKRGESNLQHLGSSPNLQHLGSSPNLTPEVAGTPDAGYDMSPLGKGDEQMDHKVPLKGDDTHGIYAPLPTTDDQEMENNFYDGSLNGSLMKMSSGSLARRGAQRGSLDRKRTNEGNVPQPKIIDIVLGRTFTKCSVALNLVNVLNIALETDRQARNSSLTASTAFMYLNSVCLGFYVFEIVMRLCAFGLGFFHWTNNNMDFVLVIVQSLEVRFDYALLESHDPIHDDVYGHLRIWRLCLLCRVVRLVRGLRLVPELAELLDSIMMSVRSLVWTMVLITLLTLIFGMFLVRLVTQHKVDLETTPGGPDFDANLGYLYGSLDRAMLGLFEAIANGISWCELVNPLRESISPYLALAYVVYISFVCFAMLNVVTAFLVDSTVRASEEGRNAKLCTSLFETFRLSDGTLPDVLDRSTFESHFNSPEMESFFDSLDLSTEEAMSYDFFRLVDADGSGYIDVHELVRGCLRLKGASKQVDFAAFLLEYRHDMMDLRQALLKNS